MKKFFTVFVCLITFLLVGCTQAIKTEKEMKIDVQNYLNSFDESHYEVENLNITERRTSKKDETDVVHVEIEASTEESKGIYSLILYYKLYEQGWLFESAQIDSQGKREVKPTKAPDQSIVDNAILKDYPTAKLKDKEILLNENKCLYYYEYICNEQYAKVDTIFCLTFEFDTEIVEWKKTDIDVVDTKYTWDIIGTWYPEDEQTIYGRKGLVLYITEHEKTGVRIKSKLNGTVYYDSIVSFDELDREGGHDFKTVTTGNLWETISISPSFVGKKNVYFHNGNLPFEKR